MSHHLLNSFKIQIKNMEITSSERLTLNLTSRRWTKKGVDNQITVRHEGNDGQKRENDTGLCPSSRG